MPLPEATLDELHSIRSRHPAVLEGVFLSMALKFANADRWNAARALLLTLHGISRRVGNGLRPVPRFWKRWRNWTEPVPYRAVVGIQLVLKCGLVLLCVERGTDAAEPIRYGRDVLPILSNGCFHCHGPDAKKREADLRLDTSEGATADLGGYQAIAPGDPDESELMRRISSDDPDERMPPAGAVIQLQPAQIDVLRRWIAHGAEYEGHWAFIAPRRPALPEVTNAQWVRNPIDTFVLVRLVREGLAPSAEADRRTLIRRLSLDLRGLPPTPVEIDSFVNDKDPQAYEGLVERMLRSPHYGEGHGMELARCGALCRLERLSG